MGVSREMLKIKAGSRVAWQDPKSTTYHYGDLLPNGARLNENGLAFLINDKVTGLVCEMPYEAIYFRVFENKTDGDFFTIEEWMRTVEAGYINEYDGSGYFTDGTYHYCGLNPFGINDINQYKHFTGVIFYGK